MKKYETVIFDLDGTLLYTLEDLTKATNYALRRMNMPERTLDDVRRFVGNGDGAPDRGWRFRRERHPEVFEQTLAIFREYYDIHCNDNTKAYDGVIDLLRELKADGYALAIVSNKPDSAVKELAEIYFEGIVKVAIGESAGVAKKPAPDTVYAALKELGMPKEGAVYVGDSEVDVMTAKNSGLPCISVLWGFREEAFLKEHGADHFVREPEEIRDFLNA